jgi:hypothetical protein
LIRSGTVSDSKWTILSRPRNHANFLATEFYTIHQLHHSGLPFLQTNIVEWNLENPHPDLIICAQDATGLDQSPPRHSNTLPCTWKSKSTGLNPQLDFALQGFALDASDLARATVKNGALKNVRI